jgi:hypothetical protein
MHTLINAFSLHVNTLQYQGTAIILHVPKHSPSLELPEHRKAIDLHCSASGVHGHPWECKFLAKTLKTLDSQSWTN